MKCTSSLLKREYHLFLAIFARWKIIKIFFFIFQLRHNGDLLESEPEKKTVIRGACSFNRKFTECRGGE